MNCNCDPAGWLAVNFTRRGLPLHFPVEEKAAVDACRCHGCGFCRRRCPDEALGLEVRLVHR